MTLNNGKDVKEFDSSWRNQIFKANRLDKAQINCRGGATILWNINYLVWYKTGCTDHAVTKFNAWDWNQVLSAAQSFTV